VGYYYIQDDNLTERSVNAGLLKTDKTFFDQFETREQSKDVGCDKELLTERSQKWSHRFLKIAPLGDRDE